MTALTNVGDDVRITTRTTNADIPVQVSGTFNMTLALQREQGSPGSNAWEPIETFVGSRLSIEERR